MLRYAIALSVLSLMLLPELARAQFKQGDWELSLQGSGTNDRDFKQGNLGATGGLGYFVTDQLEVGLRQTFNYIGLVGGGSSSFAGLTQGAVDWNFDLGRWVPYAGVIVGYQYGSALPDTWVGGPEGGVKFFVNSTTFINLSIAYNWEICHGIGDGGNGRFLYGLGIGFRF